MCCQFYNTHHKAEEILKLIHKISLRVARYLEREGYIERDEETSYLTEKALSSNDAIPYQSHSIQYRIALDPQKGKKVFAPNSHIRSSIIKKRKEQQPIDTTVQTGIEKCAAMNWATRLKRAFNIDIQLCNSCGGKVKVIACIEDPVVINKILAYLHPEMKQIKLLLNRAPPDFAHH